MMTDLDEQVPALLAHLADELSEKGELRTEPWRSALLAVPRHLFLPRFYIQDKPYTRWAPVSRESLGEQEWLRLVYTNESWVTQVEGKPWRPGVPVDGFPTSSSTMPGLVVLMLEDLGVADGMRVLEIGTGVGYSSALMSHRLEARNVVSMEYDPAVSDRARAVLDGLGYHPELVVGDGAHGYPSGAPYDRIVATCSFTHVPRAWIEQTAPGASILTAFRGGLDASAFVRLDVTENGTAQGRFYPGGISFMISRSQSFDRRTMQMPPAPEDLTQRQVEFEPDLLNDWRTFRFLLQTRLPPMIQSGTAPDGRDGGGLWSPDTDSGVAWYTDDKGETRFLEYGDQPLWPAIEQAYHDWDNLGRPSIDQFDLTVTKDAQTFQVPGSDVLWHLPA